MLCCDALGFHLFEYARNFFTSTRKIINTKVVPLKGGFIGVEYNGRNILLSVNHIGINLEAVPAILASKAFTKFKEKII